MTTRATVTTALSAAALLAVSSPLLAAQPGVVTGTFAAGETVEAIESHAPATVSRTFVKTMAATGGRASLEIPATGGSGLIVWTIPVSAGRKALARAEHGEAIPPVATTLRTPSGRAIVPGETGSSERGLRRFAFAAEETEALGLSLSEDQEVLHVAEAEAGIHQLELVADASMGLTVVAAEPDSKLTLSSWAGPLSRQPGEPLTLHAELADGGSPVAGARVTARLAAPGKPAGAEIDLFDDGRHDDGAANDGVYAATVADPGTVAGHWAVRFDAAGRDTRGNAFARTGSSGFVNESGAARLLPVTATVVGEGADRRLRVTGAARVDVAGDYRFDVIVAGAKAGDGARPGIGWAEATSPLATGRAPLAVEVPIGAAAGPLHVDARLLGLDPMGVAGRMELDVNP